MTVKECKSKEDTDQWMDENNGLWMHGCKRSSDKFADIVYYCDHSVRNRPRNFSCTAAMRIGYAKDLTATSMAFIQTSGEHDHTRLKDTGLSSPVKMSIKNKDEPCGGMTARVIQRKLEKELELSSFKKPTQQIQNQKAHRAKKRGFSKTLSIKDLRQYYELHKQIPEDIDQSFVVAYKDEVITTREGGEVEFVVQFIMVFSTLKLLHRQVSWPVMQVDGNYKLMTLNYPLLLSSTF